MSAKKHTPGPWTFLEDGDAEALHNCRPLTICSPGKDDLAEVFSDEDSTVAIPREQAIANARLIAASPDLLAALQEAVIAMSAATEHLPVNELPRIACNTAIANARAALSRATGSQP